MPKLENMMSNYLGKILKPNFINNSSNNNIGLYGRNKQFIRDN
jgi:hypothetical protein